MFRSNNNNRMAHSERLHAPVPTDRVERLDERKDHYTECCRLIFRPSLPKVWLNRKTNTRWPACFFSFAYFLNSENMCFEKVLHCVCFSALEVPSPVTIRSSMQSKIRPRQWRNPVTPNPQKPGFLNACKLIPQLLRNLISVTWLLKCMETVTEWRQNLKKAHCMI